MKRSVRCTYLKSCYLAEALDCYGFKIDCPLYMRTNDEPCNVARFDAAMDKLILQTKRKHDAKTRIEAAKKPASLAGKTCPSLKVKV